jgi:hypothetical protein
MYGVMGISNAQRHLEQIRSLTEFISQDGIKEVVPMYVSLSLCLSFFFFFFFLVSLPIFGMGYGCELIRLVCRISLVNEVMATTVGKDVMAALYVIQYGLKHGKGIDVRI